MSALSFLRSQLFVTPPVPTYDFTGQTIIITGANRGIGLEAARHLLKLKAARVILAVRSAKRGQDAADELESSTGRAGAVQVEELDMASYESVKVFAARMESRLERLDAVLLNAGMYTHTFSAADGFESHLTVNVINTIFLALLLLPTLRKGSRSERPRISFVSSDRHVMFKLPEWKEEKPFEFLSDEKRARMQERLISPISLTNSKFTNREQGT
jgi:NAD(P)-dependent dehydrogenase (short-subunit alcohol dehydrogenase family)